MPCCPVEFSLALTAKIQVVLLIIIGSGVADPRIKFSEAKLFDAWPWRVKNSNNKKLGQVNPL